MKRAFILALIFLFLWGCGVGSPPPKEPAPARMAGGDAHPTTPPPAQIDLAPLEQKVAQLETAMAKLRKDVDMVMAVRFPKAKKK